MIIHDRINIYKVPTLTKNQYKLNGCTALLDIVGFTIKHFESIYQDAKKVDIPNRTLFIMNTNGLDNASHQYSSQKIKEMIHRHTEFLFMGANIDAIQTA